MLEEHGLIVRDKKTGREYSVWKPGETKLAAEDFFNLLESVPARQCPQRLVPIGRAITEIEYLLRYDANVLGKRLHAHTGGPDRTEELPAGSLAFTLCGIPVIYRLGTTGSLRLHRRNEEPLSFDTPVLDQEWSGRLFSRDPAILRIEVEVDPGELR